MDVISSTRRLTIEWWQNQTRSCARLQLNNTWISLNVCWLQWCHPIEIIELCLHCFILFLKNSKIFFKKKQLKGVLRVACKILSRNKQHCIWFHHCFIIDNKCRTLNKKITQIKNKKKFLQKKPGKKCVVRHCPIPTLFLQLFQHQIQDILLDKSLLNCNLRLLLWRERERRKKYFECCLATKFFCCQIKLFYRRTSTWRWNWNSVCMW